MSEFDPSLVRFRIVNGVLVSPEGHIDSIGAAVMSTLKRVEPKTAASDEPCVAIPATPHFTLRLPGAHEHIYLEESDDTMLELFWAIDDQTSEPTLVVCDCCHEGPANHLWVAVLNDGAWYKIPAFQQIAQRFPTASDAWRKYPTGIVAIVSKFSGFWNEIEVHSFGGMEDDSVRYATDPGIIAMMRIPSQFVRIPIELWLTRSTFQGSFQMSSFVHSRLNDACVVWVGYNREQELIVVAREASEKYAFIRFHRLSIYFETTMQDMRNSMYNKNDVL